MTELEIVTLSHPDFLPPSNLSSWIILIKFTYHMTSLLKGFPLCFDYLVQIPLLGLQGPVQSDTCPSLQSYLQLLPSIPQAWRTLNNTYPRAFVCAFLWERQRKVAWKILPQLLAQLAHSYSLTSSKCHLFRALLLIIFSKSNSSLTHSSLFHQIIFSVPGIIIHNVLLFPTRMKTPQGQECYTYHVHCYIPMALFHNKCSKNICWINK